MLFNLVNLIKKLVALDVIWGTRTKKLTGVNDRFNFTTKSGISFLAGANTITIPGFTDIPAWAVPEKYFRYYDGPVKTTTSSTAPNYVAQVVLTPNNSNNSGVMFQIQSATINAGNLVITVDPTAPGVGSIVTRTVATQGTIDARIAIVTNNPVINRINAYGATVFNLQNQDATGMPDGSCIAEDFADHYHDGSTGGGPGSNSNIDDIVTAPYKVRIISQGGTEMTEYFQTVVIDAWGYVVTSPAPTPFPLDPLGNKLYNPNGHYKTPDPIGVKPKSLKAD